MRLPSVIISIPLEHPLGLGDGLVDVRREEQVSSSGLLDDIIQSGLVDGEVVRVPGVNSGLVQVDNGDLDLGTKEVSDHLGDRSRDQGQSISGDGSIRVQCAEKKGEPKKRKETEFRPKRERHRKASRFTDRFVAGKIRSGWF